MRDVVDNIKGFKRGRNNRIRGGNDIGIIRDNSGSVKELIKWVAISGRIIAGNKAMWENPSVPLRFKRACKSRHPILVGYEK
jgi:hypothetical protein